MTSFRLSAVIPALHAANVISTGYLPGHQRNAFPAISQTIMRQPIQTMQQHLFLQVAVTVTQQRPVGNRQLTLRMTPSSFRFIQENMQEPGIHAPNVIPRREA